MNGENSMDNNQLNSNQQTLMLIDDARFIRQMSEKLLTKMGHEVLLIASNGEEALEMFFERWVEIDIILLDIVMPKMDGLQTLKQILKINPYAKVVIVSSISDKSIIQSCLDAGASDYIVKPFKISDFNKAIEIIAVQSERALEDDSDFGTKPLDLSTLEKSNLMKIAVEMNLSVDMNSSKNSLVMKLQENLEK